MYNVYAQCIVAHITHKVSLGTTYTIFSSFHSSDTDTKVKHIKYSIGWKEGDLNRKQGR